VSIRPAPPGRNIPPLLTSLVDDAAMFPPGSAPLAEALPAHREHRDSWYAPLIGPLLVPAVDTAGVAGPIEVGLIGPREALVPATDELPAEVTVRQWESPVAKRGEDPLPGLKSFLALIEGRPIRGYAEIPLTFGLMSALDYLAESGAGVSPKFRTGGIAAELFPTPVELAAVICACRDRGLSFKLTAGLHHAVRHTDPETAQLHHGFVNVLAATLAAVDGAEPADLAEILAGTDPQPLTEALTDQLARERPLWIGFGSCSVAEPLADLATLGLVATP
jgi:hypothetical protein